jgi:hypothetical protein
LSFEKAEQAQARVLAYLEAENARDIIRDKLSKLLVVFNNGSVVIKRYGLSVNVLSEFDKLMYSASNGDAIKALRILRE